MTQGMGSSGIEEEPAQPGPPSGKMSDMKLVVIAIAVIIVLLVAVVAVSISSDKEEDEVGELDATMTPDRVDVDAGESVELYVNATWEGDSIDDSPNATFSWHVVGASLGIVANPNARIVTFTAGAVSGAGSVGCAVEYNDSGALSHIDVTADLTVNPPSLASLTVSPSAATVVYDRVAVFNATALDTLGQPLTNLTVGWTLEGIPAANMTLNATTGYSVNFTANTSGTAWLNATATYHGVTMKYSVTIRVIEHAPAITMSRTRLTDGIKWTIDSVDGELMWNEIDVTLTDGTNTVNWSLTMGGLASGSMNKTEFGVRTLGAMLVYLNVTDVAGNGSVEVGDYFTFTTSAGKFNPAKSYVVTLVYRPTGDVIVQSTFVG